MIKYLYKQDKLIDMRWILLKALFCSLIWTALFLLFSFYSLDKFDDFVKLYTEKAESIELHIKDGNWDNATKALDEYDTSFNESKDSWYKVFNHEYFEEISLYLDILHGSIYAKDEGMSLEQIQRIKNALHNIIENEQFDLNHIF